MFMLSIHCAIPWHIVVNLGSFVLHCFICSPHVFFFFFFFFFFFVFFFFLFFFFLFFVFQLHYYKKVSNHSHPSHIDDNAL